MSKINPKLREAEFDGAKHFPWRRKGTLTAKCYDAGITLVTLLKRKKWFGSVSDAQRERC